MRNLQALNIRKLDHLAKLLGAPEAYVEGLSGRCDRMYRRRELPKKSGGTRVLQVPKGELKQVQRRLNGLLQRVELPECMHGCRPGHSIVHNALPHVGKPMVVKIDVKDFFASVRPDHVYRAFVGLGCSPDVSHVLTRLTTHKFELPQGAPTSPALANLVFAPIALRFQRLAEAHRADYTDYVDDNAFSGPRYLPRLLPLICKILGQSGFRVKTEKSRGLDRSGEQVVTGVKVNVRLDVPEAYVNETEALIGQYNAQGGGEGSVQGPQILGRINFIRSLNPALAHQLARQFRAS